MAAAAMAMAILVTVIILLMSLGLGLGWKGSVENSDEEWKELRVDWSLDVVNGLVDRWSNLTTSDYKPYL